MRVSEGAAESGFLAASRTLASIARWTVLAVVGGSALLIVPPDRRWGAIAVYVLLLVWAAVILVVQRRGPAAWILWPDTALLVTLCLLQPVLEVPLLMRQECGWIAMTAETVIVVHQWQFRRWPVLRADALIVTAYVVGAALTDGARVRDILLLAPWLVIVTVMSQAVVSSLVQVTRRIDEARVAGELERRRIDVARAVREAQAEHLATLHDTAAATLLMLGTGAVAGDGAELRRQAVRDLAVLTSPDRDGGTDLGARLRQVVEESGLQVALTGAAVGPLPPAAVEAVAGAVGEALRNVERHAGTDRAVVFVRTDGAGVRVEVRDAGGGFAPGSLHGHGIRQSIVGRMERAGGSANITALPGGVLVSLVWEPRSVLA